ncbi:MAG TPA: tyrosinase family protein [Thermoanaerobaculia bacterium]|nr:tyrosinase family protein [Thermoanaerobaculia bacterium]
MAPLTRRTFVAGTAAIPFALWFEQFAQAQTGFIRYDARSTQGKAMLKIYAGAVRKMRNKTLYSEGNPRSWTFQWYTHFVRGDRTKTAEINRIYPSPSAWKNLAQEMWNTCQAHNGQPEDYFLPWHRMFVYYFEQIIRKVSGEPTFTLPYWNYSVSGPNHGVMPVEFRKPLDLVYGPLYVEKRNPGVNAGDPIDEGEPDDPLSLDSLEECQYSQNGSNQGFCLALDGGLHGNVHVLVGNGQNMGSVPWAAYDPIFWLHHSNIDRLWASWNAAGRLNPSGSTFLNKTFVFADGNGNKVVATIKDFLSISALHYKYQKLEPVPPCASAATTGVQGAEPRKLATVAGIALGAQPARATLTAPPSPVATVPIGEAVEHLKANQRLFLVVRDLKTDIQPEVIYHLYLQLTSNAGGSGDFYVGSINFFDAHHENAEKFRSFDVTDLAKELRAKGLLNDTAELTIAPAGEPAADAKPVIGEVSLVSQ